MIDLLLIYVTLAAVGSVFGAVIFAIDGRLLGLDLATEGRVVLGVLAGLLWPFVALYFFCRVVGRGVVQCWRLVVPVKVSSLPSARVVRK